jgi:hypothetical protein
MCNSNRRFQQLHAHKTHSLSSIRSLFVNLTIGLIIRIEIRNMLAYVIRWLCYIAASLNALLFA